MSQMDIAGGMLAKELMQGRCATVAADAFKFIRPVSVGDIVCCYGNIKHVGTTSLTVGLEVWVKRDNSDYMLVTAADFTYVAITDDGIKREYAKTDPRLKIQS